MRSMRFGDLDDIPPEDLEGMRPSPVELARITDPRERLLQADRHLLLYKKATSDTAAIRRLTVFHMIEELGTYDVDQVAGLLNTSRPRVSQLLAEVRKELGLPPSPKGNRRGKGVRTELMERLRNIADDDPRLPLIALALGETPETIAAAVSSAG